MGDANDEVLAWHFTGSALRDDRPIPIKGEWLTHEGPVTICKSGLHASENLIDALWYAPGLTLHRVTCRNIINKDRNKLVARGRRIERSADMSRAVAQWAGECALLAEWFAAGADAARVVVIAATDASAIAAADAAYVAVVATAVATSVAYVADTGADNAAIAAIAASNQMEARLIELFEEIAE